MDIDIKKGQNWGFAIGEDDVGLSFNYMTQSNIKKFGQWFHTASKTPVPNENDEIVASPKSFGRK